MQKAVLSLSLILVCLLWYRANGQSDGDLRLVSSSGFTGRSSGRLEIYYNFQWGTVCDDSFGSTDANVACRQLGYDIASSYGSVGSLGFSSASFTTRTWLDDVNCSGFESRLASCSHNGYGLENCDHTEDVALFCRSYTDGDLRLVSSSGTGGSFGRLEIYYTFQWGTVCDDSFGSTEANVACRQLGYTSASRFGSVGSLGFSSASFTTRTWLDDVICSGFESRLASCSHNGYGLENCDHFEDVAVFCTNFDSPVISTGTTNFVSVIVGSIVGGVFFLIIVVVICIVCCVCCIASCSSSSRRVPVAQPPTTSNVVAYTTTQATTGYPTEQAYPAGPQQPPSTYPTQQDPYSNKEPVNPEFSAGAPPAYNNFSAYPPPANPYLPNDPTGGVYPPTDPNAGYPPDPGYPTGEQYPPQPY